MIKPVTMYSIICDRCGKAFVDCGNCHWFDNEDAYGVGWCCNNEHESSCDQVCDEHEF